ncbi:cupin domain-containing protein [Dactylosporangium sp. NPDC000555]|uniref:cupin domain-containing protein n=1 Tax=Dactylosporangium sp. NPDC000555 TaxID=3154260 RepID=UPI00331FC8EF
MQGVRRVVTGVNEAGASIVVQDGIPPNVVAPGGGTGYAWTDVWITDDVSSAAEGGDHAPNTMSLEPPRGGITWKVIVLPPASALKDMDWPAFQAEMRERAPLMSGTGQHDRNRPGFHRTDTIDFVVIISGELVLELEDGEVRVGPGDCVVQRGTWHAWHNRGSEPCVMSAVLVSTPE